MFLRRRNLSPFIPFLLTIDFHRQHGSYLQNRTYLSFFVDVSPDKKYHSVFFIAQGS